MAGDSIEGELPELLKAVLAADPDVFKGGCILSLYWLHPTLLAMPVHQLIVHSTISVFLEMYRYKT